jgi:ferredoxin
MRIVADQELCIGSGMCVLTSEELFDQDPDDGHVIVRVEHPSPAQLEHAREAVAQCPSQALSLDDE